MALTRIISEIIQDNTIQDADISSSLSTGISGSFGSQRVSTTDNVQFNHITASGNISSSGNIYGTNITASAGFTTTIPAEVNSIGEGSVISKSWETSAHGFTPGLVE